MTVENKLIILRDKFKYSQQHVADALGISKSTYCRYEQGKSELGLKELDAVLQLYGLTYEEFSGIDLPIVHEVSYPEKILRNLEDVIRIYGTPGGGYRANYEKYKTIKDALEPLISIREKAMDFPNIHLSELPRNTTVKILRMDMRGERLIDEALKILSVLFQAMQKDLHNGLK